MPPGRPYVGPIVYIRPSETILWAIGQIRQVFPDIAVFNPDFCGSGTSGSPRRNAHPLAGLQAPFSIAHTAGSRSLRQERQGKALVLHRLRPYILCR